MVGCNQNINNMHNSFTNILKKTSVTFASTFLLCAMLLTRWMYFLMLPLLPRSTPHEAMEPKKKNLSMKNYHEMLDSTNIYTIKSLMC